MFASGYNRLFWAMMFIIFDINLGPINILPGFIGYLLFYSGLNILSEQHKIFEKGKTISVMLTLLTIKDIVKPQVNLFMAGPFEPIGFILTVVNVIATALNLYLIYIACRGIYLVCEEREIEELKVSTSSRWSFYLIISIVMMFYLPFSLNLSRDYAVLGIIAVIVYIIASLSIAMLFRKSRLELGDDYKQEGEG